MKLHFLIPAYNEELGIEIIIKRSLAARQTIITNSPVDEVGSNETRASIWTRGN